MPIAEGNTQFLISSLLFSGFLIQSYSFIIGISWTQDIYFHYFQLIKQLYEACPLYSRPFLLQRGHKHTLAQFPRCPQAHKPQTPYSPKTYSSYAESSTALPLTPRRIFSPVFLCKQCQYHPSVLLAVGRGSLAVNLWSYNRE